MNMLKKPWFPGIAFLVAFVVCFGGFSIFMGILFDRKIERIRADIRQIAVEASPQASAGTAKAE